MREYYQHVATFLEATKGEGLVLIQRLEKARPEPAVTPVTLRPLQRLKTPDSRRNLLNHIPTTRMASLSPFTTAVDKAEHDMWLDWHWEAAPDSHIHQDRRQDLHLKATIATTTPTSALKVVLGAWSWKPRFSELPRWEVLKKAALWNAVFYTAHRRRLAAPATEWLTTRAPEDVVSLSTAQDVEEGPLPPRRWDGGWDWPGPDNGEGLHYARVFDKKLVSSGVVFLALNPW